MVWHFKCFTSTVVKNVRQLTMSIIAFTFLKLYLEFSVETWVYISYQYLNAFSATSSHLNS